jgi:hypothetical protein
MTGPTTFQPEPGFTQLHPNDRAQWHMAGQGDITPVADSIVETHGGTGMLWYAEEFEDFILRLQWRMASIEDNSGVYIRFPADALHATEPDWERGLEIQLDDRGFDPEAHTFGSLLHLTGAIYKRAPATRLASLPVGQWNDLEVEARGDRIRVMLNGEEVSTYQAPPELPRRGHLGLQNHHEGSRVQFRWVRVQRL